MSAAVSGNVCYIKKVRRDTHERLVEVHDLVESVGTCRVRYHGRFQGRTSNHPPGSNMEVTFVKPMNSAVRVSS